MSQLALTEHTLYLGSRLQRFVRRGMPLCNRMPERRCTVFPVSLRPSWAPSLGRR